MTMPHSSHERELEGYIRDGMARAIWGHAYIQWATNVEPPPQLRGGTWADVTPPTDPAALEAAGEFADGIGRMNNLGAHPMSKMFLASRRYVQPMRSSQRATEGDQAFVFGEDVAQACLGTLDVPELGQYKLPEMKVMLDDDGRYLSWDEGWTWHRGGAVRGVPDGSPTENPSGDTMWSILVNGGRQWVGGGTSQEALETAKAQYGRQATLESGPNGEPIRTGECDTEAPKKTRTPKAARPPASALHVTAVPMSLDEFAQAVLNAMPAIQETVGPSGRPAGRFGDKVFIAAIGRQLRTDPRFSGMTIQQLKRRLIEANRAQMLNLSRADSRGDMDDLELADSEINDMGASFHFVTRGQGPPALSLQEFARAVNEVVPAIQTGRGPDGRPVGRFGKQKVFVAAIWRRLKNDPRFADMERQASMDRTPVPLAFKRRLVEANRARLISLARADLVGAMDPTEVADSEINDMGADFHFVADTTYGPAY